MLVFSTYLCYEKSLEYYKLRVIRDRLCGLTSDSGESDRLTLKVETIIQGAWALELWTKRFAKAFSSTLVV